MAEMEYSSNIKETLKKISSYSHLCEHGPSGHNIFDLLYMEWVQILEEKKVFRSEEISLERIIITPENVSSIIFALELDKIILDEEAS